MKVVGVGYPRTGTKTLGEIFARLRFRNASWDACANSKYENNRLEDLMAAAEGYDSFEDLPWCCLYKEIDQRFPGSKFILTLRKSEAAWYDSFRKHEVRLSAREFMPFSGKVYDDTVEIYRRHNAAVREYFKDRPGDLLEVCWETGSGWAEISQFLNLTGLGDQPLPHMNKTSKKATFILYKILVLDLIRRLLSRLRLPQR